VLTALERLLIQRNLVSVQELESSASIDPAKSTKRVLMGADVKTAMLAGAPVERADTQSAKYGVGDVVQVINEHKLGHTRLPGYVKGHTGTVHKVHGCHVYADDNAAGRGENPQWVYNIKFNAQDLWGQARSQAGYVHVDCWEPYLTKAKTTTSDVSLSDHQ